jgi:DNA-binding PadR family transcriptional regulator
VDAVPKPLSTTSYAILGLLSLRSWTGYELAQQGKRSLSLFWPKEESVIYEEPRRLAALDLATAKREVVDGRSRNRYSITDAGLAELRAWLAGPGVEPKLEFESMVRLLGAHEGTVSDALAAISTMRTWAERNLAVNVKGGRAILADGGLFPRRQSLNAIAGLLMVDIYNSVLDWADAAEKEIATWERTDEIGLTDGARALMEQWIATHPTRLGEPQ